MAAKTTRKGKGSSQSVVRGRGRGRQRNAVNRLPQVSLAIGLAVAGLLFVPVLAESAVPWLSTARTTVRGLLGAGSYLAPVLLLGLAALLALSLRSRGFRLHWARVVGWLAFFLGVLGLLHFIGANAANPSAVETAGGSLGRLLFESAVSLVGPWLAVGLLFLLAAGGAVAGFGIPLQQFRGVWRTSRRFGRTMHRLLRAALPVMNDAAHGAMRLARRSLLTLRSAAKKGSARARLVFAAASNKLGEFAETFKRDKGNEIAGEEPSSVAALAAVTAAVPAPAKAKPAPNGSVKPPATSGFEAARVNGENGWELPPVTILEEGAEPSVNPLDDEERLRSLERTIEKTLIDFGVPVKVVERRPGPTVTQFGIEPQFHEKRARDGTVLRREKVKVREITARANDLALALAARSIRMEAPVPGRPFVGIEVPNQATSVVCLRSELESRGFQKALAKFALPIVLGRDVSGEVVTGDLAKMPHLLIAGATGSGKSVCINSIIATLLMNHTPEELRFLMVDPKRVELTLFDSIPHLLRPVVVDVDKAVPALFQAVAEMDRRYKEFAALGVRNIEGYNRLIDRDPERKRLPFLVVVIDELADLMMLAADEVERTICRLAQLARATGIHLVVATQRPSVDVVTGLIKANFPTRISFMVTSQVDSRTILDTVGAEKLLGRGDMLYLPSDAPKPMRLQGTFLTDKEIEDLTAYWRAQRGTQYAPEFVDLPAWTPGAGDESDELYDRAVELAHEHESISISFLQRRLRVGWNRAARLMDMLEENGELRGNDDRDEDPGADRDEEN